jgi:hypothetical protein
MRSRFGELVVGKMLLGGNNSFFKLCSIMFDIYKRTQQDISVLDMSVKCF